MNNKIINRTIDIAMAMCPLKFEHRCSHIAFLIRKSKIKHIAFNSVKSHPFTEKYKYGRANHTGLHVGLHAELNVCIKSNKEDLSDFKMIVLRVDRNGKLNNSKPCLGCQRVIKQFNVGEVWYSSHDGNVLQF